MSDPGDHIALANGGMVLPGEGRAGDGIVDQKHLWWFSSLIKGGQLEGRLPVSDWDLT